MLRLSDLLQMNGLIMNMSPVCEQSLKAFLSDQMTDERVCWGFSSKAINTLLESAIN